MKDGHFTEKIMTFYFWSLNRKCVETSGEEPPPMSGSSACIVGGKSMYVFAGHHDGGPSSTVSFSHRMTSISELE